MNYVEFADFIEFVQNISKKIIEFEPIIYCKRDQHAAIAQGKHIRMIFKFTEFTKSYEIYVPFWKNSIVF